MTAVTLRLIDPADLCFIDLEASGLEPECYPTEIGWAWISDGAVVSGSVLIRPPAEWRGRPGSWYRDAEAVTGISLALLDEQGVSPAEAFTLFTAAASDRILVTDSPSTDGAWLRQLATAAGQSTTSLRLANLKEITASLGSCSDLLRVEEVARQREPREHRAEPDARRNAQVIAVLAGF